MNTAKVTDCNIIWLPKIVNRSGNLTAVHGNSDIPFPISRVFHLYDIPGGESRGAHSHIECHQFLVAASGSFDVMVDDGICKKVFNLNRPYFGLHIPPGIWAEEFNFSSGGICLVLASHNYNENDYIRSYEDYINGRK